MEAALKKIATLQLFKGLDLKSIEKVLRASKVRSYKKDELIFERGEPTKNFYILIDGQIELEQEGKSIKFLEGPCIIGELGLFLKGKSHSVNAHIQRDSILLKISYGNLNLLFRNDLVLKDQVLWNLAFIIGQRLRSNNDMISELMEKLKYLKEFYGQGDDNLNEEIEADDIDIDQSQTPIYLSFPGIKGHGLVTRISEKKVHFRSNRLGDLANDKSYPCFMTYNDLRPLSMEIMIKKQVTGDVSANLTETSKSFLELLENISSNQAKKEI